MPPDLVILAHEGRVLTSNYSAQFGEAAGAMTEVDTKSGSNQFHGDAWEFLRNDKLNANTFFSNLAGIPRPAFRRNEFGGNNRRSHHSEQDLFLWRLPGHSPHIPADVHIDYSDLGAGQMTLTGNFGALGVPIYNPYQTQTMNGQVQRVPFADNQIPTNLLDQAALNMVRLLPTPTTSGTTYKFTFNPPLKRTTDQFDVRLDQKLGRIRSSVLPLQLRQQQSGSPRNAPSARELRDPNRSVHCD